MELEKILSDIVKGQISPCYLLCGDEEYLLRDALDKIIGLIILPADRDLNLFVIDGDAEDIDSLCESLLTLPLIPGHKVIVVRNTRVFHSRKTLPSIVQKIREQAKTNPGRVAADFILFLSMTGWMLDDLKNDGWRKISDEQWQQTLEGDEGRDREAWLPIMAEFCIKHGPAAGFSIEGTDRLETVLKEGLPEGNHLIMTAETVDRRKKLFKTLDTVGIVIEFVREKGEAKQRGLLMENARDLLAVKGKKMSPGAWLALGKKTGFNLRTSMTSIDKLITFTGERKTIDERDIDAVIGKTREETVFNLTAAMVEKNLAASLTILKDLLDQGDHPLMILAMFAREIRILLQAKLLLEAGSLVMYKAGMEYGRFQKTLFPEIKKKLGTTTPHPYVIYQGLNHAGRFSRESLIRYLNRLVDIDLAMKSTSKDARLLLERFLVQICG